MIRNSCIDVFRCFAAFLVVCIHVNFTGKFGIAIVALAKMAVPFFFIVSGFYLGDLIKKPNYLMLKKKIHKIFYLVIISNGLYFLLYAIWSLGMNNFKRYIFQILNVRSIFKFLIFNDSPFSGHLWFLGAMLYVLIIIYLCCKFKIVKYCYFLIPFLLCFDLLFGTYSIVVFGKLIPYCITRNFIFVGIPYMLIGNFLFIVKDKICGRVSNFWLLLFILVYSVTSIMEKFYLMNNNLVASREHYISSTFLAILAFVFCLNNPKLGNGTVFEKWGRVHSLTIYIVHFIVINILGQITSDYGIIDQYIYIDPIIVFIFSLLISISIEKIRNKLSCASQSGQTPLGK